MEKHYSGYVNIIGLPNVGKSTLMNAILGEKMMIISHKPQTTRHRIIGIHNEPDYQIVFSDTPGMINDPNYKMQHAMNDAAFSVFEDADVILFMTQMDDSYTGEEKVIEKLRTSKAPVFLIINKIDTSDQESLLARAQAWQSWVDFDEIHYISALEKAGIEHLIESIKKKLPEGPVYYPKDQISDRSTRFFVSEIVREKILYLYKQEIPYSAEVVVEEYKESEKRGEDFARIRAVIYVMRDTQKSILIGKGGTAIKQLGIQARKDIEKFVGHKVHLELFVKVRDKWRDDERFLKSFGYLH